MYDYIPAEDEHESQQGPLNERGIALEDCKVLEAYQVRFFAICFPSFGSLAAVAYSNASSFDVLPLG